MKTVISIFILFVSVSAFAETPAGTYLGYEAVEQKIQSRIIKPGTLIWSLSMHLTGIINEDPYGGGWIIKIAVRDVSELDGLMAADGYEAMVG